MNGLRVVQTPVRFHPFYGGVEKYVLELSKQLVTFGNDVTVVCADEPHAGANLVHGVKVIRLPYVTKIANTNITLRLFRTLMAEDFDVIHTHIPTPWSADISALVSLLKRKPLYVTYHNDLTGKGPGSLLADIYNATVLHLVLRRARKIVITQRRYAEYSRHLKPYRKKLVVIPPGVSEPVDADGLNREVNQIFFMSVLDRHHDYKGLDVLLGAMAEVKLKYPEAKLLVGGGGELIPVYKRLARSLGVSESVQFLGALSEQKLAEAYGSSSIFVLPSLNKLEGFGIVALEALSYGTPVITTHITGTSEFIKNNQAGLIVPPGDVTALARAMIVLLEDQRGARLMGGRGAAAVNREFGWSGVAQQMIDLY